MDNRGYRACCNLRRRATTVGSVAGVCVALSAILLAGTAHLVPAGQPKNALGDGAGTLGSDLIFVRIPVERLGGEPPDGQAPGGPVSGRGLDDEAPLPVGSHIVRYSPASQTLVRLTSGFAAAGRPDVSFDGKRILFVAKRSRGGRFYVWEMNADGTGVRQVTSETGPVRSAIYLSTIYTIDADEPVYQIAFCAGPGATPAIKGMTGSSDPSADPMGSLFTCRLNGRRIRRITFNPYGASDPFLLSDGRLLHSSWHPSKVKPAKRGQADEDAAHLASTLLTVNTDGTDLFVFSGAPRSDASDAGRAEPVARRRGMACETSDGWVVFVESRDGGVDHGGVLLAADRARSLHTERVVADDPDGLYRSPAALPDGRLLVSYRDQGDGTYGLYLFDWQSGERIATVVDSPDWHEVDAQLLAPRPVPAGRSSVVDDRVTTGQLYCMNAYLSQMPGSKPMAAGAIKSLRVFRAVVDLHELAVPEPKASGRFAVDTLRWAPRRVMPKLIGEVPIESDGSFFLEVPARTPLRLQTLGNDGTILSSMSSWFWVMPKEARGCVGCHEDRELTPPNVHSLALRKPPRPVGVEEGRAEQSPK